MPETWLTVGFLWHQPGCGNEGGTTNSQSKGVSRTHHCGKGECNLADPCGAIIQGPCCPTEIIQKVMDHVCEMDALVVGLEAHLHGAPQPPTPGQSQSH